MKLNLKLKKLNGAPLILLLLRAVFILIIIFELNLLYNVYQDLIEQENITLGNNPRISRINFELYKQASSRYINSER